MDLPANNPPPTIFPSRVGMIPFQIYSPTVISAAPSQIPIGIKVILATTWSKPSEAKLKIGNQMPTSSCTSSKGIIISTGQISATPSLYQLPKCLF
jgi:hypothetical protein